MPILLLMLQYGARIQRNSITRESSLFKPDNKNGGMFLQYLDDVVTQWMVEVELVQRTFYFDCLAFYRLAPAAKAMIEDMLTAPEVTPYIRKQRAAGG
jgi:hypothetical protein